MKRLTRATFVFFMGTILWTCKETKTAGEAQTDDLEMGETTFFLVRHAEIDLGDPGDEDPELVQKGLGRAMHWAKIFEDVDLDAIYVTDHKRTSMSAAPTAVKKGLEVQYFDDAYFDIDQFKASNRDKKVLVVGQAESVPLMVNQLIGTDKYMTMDTNDYGSLYIVKLVNGTPTDTRLHINCNCPER